MQKNNAVWLAQPPESFVKSSSQALGEMFEAVTELSCIELSSLKEENATLVIVDMINGFVNEGALASPNSKLINEPVAKLAAAWRRAGLPAAALADSHGESSPEFLAFPKHCLAESYESLVTKEITEAYPEIKIIPKNCTNAMVEPKLAEWIEKNGAKTVVVAGVCTDICVMQLVCSLKAWFNSRDTESRIIVPVNLTATYDAPGHESVLVNTVSLYLMQNNGAELCRDINF